MNLYSPIIPKNIDQNPISNSIQYWLSELHQLWILQFETYNAEETHASKILNG